MKSISAWLLLIFLGVFTAFLPAYVWAGTTGKLTGRVIDATTHEPLMGVNVIIEGTYLGAATNSNGYYVVLNIPPGIYTVVAQMIGYQKQRITNVKVTIGLTTELNFELKQQALDLGETVTIVAERPMIIKDLTSTSARISNSEIEAMPVEKFSEVVSLQAGVMRDAAGNLHIRGGRSNEIAYLIDGITVTDPFSGNIGIEVENSAIQEIEVISGTFNAEYGQAMSGVINIVTKEGSDKFAGEISGYLGDYYSHHKTLFQHVDHLDIDGITNFQTTLSGPIPFTREKLRFFTTFRHYYDQGYLYGIRRFLPSDSCNFSSNDPTQWYIEQSGDGKYVSMNPFQRTSFHGKLTYRVCPTLKLSYALLWDKGKSKYYDHTFRLNPDGVATNYKTEYSHNFIWNHVLSSKTFYTLKAAITNSNYKSYVYENPYDSRYVHPKRLMDASNYAFRTGGTQMWHFYRTTRTYLGKFDLRSQVSPLHNIGLGIEARLYHLKLHEFEIVNLYGIDNTTFVPAIPSINAHNHNYYSKWPYEISAYLQDKMEYTRMIINAGIRYDYFNANSEIPIDLRNPDNSSKLFRRRVWLREVSGKHQISPRIGISFPISDQGAIHISYGHFFQIPAFEYLYRDPEFEVVRSSVAQTLMGNADLKPQRTVIYEIGLQQKLMENIAIDITGYYKDIRNLLGTEIRETYEGYKYARYVNRDYGNVRGIVLSLRKRHSNYVSADVDYTYQVAEGNASDPNAVFLDNQTDPPIESEKIVVPLDWDQTHTLNFGITVGDLRNWGLSLIGKLSTGTPYTISFRYQKDLVRFENNGRKPNIYSFDLKVYKRIRLIGNQKATVTMLVYNLFDRKNELYVYSSTGRATYDTDALNAGLVRGVNTVAEYIRNPGMYAPPRQIRVMLSYSF